WSANRGCGFADLDDNGRAADSVRVEAGLVDFEGANWTCTPRVVLESGRSKIMERKMKKLIAICLPVIALFALNAHSQMEEPLKLIQTIPLPGLHDGDFDHFALDLSGQRLFLAAEDNSAVEVLDLRTNKMVHTINGPKTPHSLAYNPDSKKLFVVDGDPSQVEIYDGTTFRSLGAIPMAANADASIYDPAGKLLYVGN